MPWRAGNRARLACVVVFALAPACIASETSVTRIVDAFVAALTADSLAAFEAISATPVSGHEWSAIREVAETMKCIDVHSYRMTIEKGDDSAATVALELDAAGIARGATNARVIVPRSWILEIACNAEACRVYSALLRERVVARRLLAAPKEEREAIVRTDGIDGAVLARELIDDALFQPGQTIVKRDIPEIAAFSRELARRSGDLAAESFCVRLLSVHLLYSGNSVPVAEEALDLATRSGDLDAVASATFSLGLARWASGDLAAGLADLRRASSALDRLRDPRIGLKAMAMSAWINSQAGELRTAVRAAQALSEESVRYGWIEGEASAANYLGLVHFILNSPVAGRAHLEISYRKALEARNWRNEVYALNNLAEWEYRAGDLHGAASTYRRAIARMDASNPFDRSALYNGLLGTLVRAGRLAEAERELDRTFVTARQIGGGPLRQALANLAELRLAQGRPRNALAAAEEALSVPGAVGLADPGIWLAHTVHGKALRRLGRLREAETAMRRAIEEIEAQRLEITAGENAASRYFEDKLEPYAELARLLVARGEARDALRISERMRARTLTVALEQGRVDVSASMTTAEKERERDLNARLAELNRTLLENPKSAEARAARNETRLELDRFREELVVSYPALHLRRPSSDVNLTIPAALSDTVIIEYLVAERGVIVMSARRGKEGRTLVTAKFVPLSSKRLETLTTTLITAVERRDAGYREHARALYDLLLLPVEEQLRARKRVCIIPDGVLWGLPFQALVDRDGRHVIERTTLFYAASLRTLALAATHTPRERRGQLLAFGDPQLSTKAASEAIAFQRDMNVGALPDAKREVETIRRLYPTESAKVFVGAAASEDVFKDEAEHHRVIHVAAHGLFDERAPMYSALLLSAPANGSEDGFLEAREIADLALNSDVAILSACDTGRGRYGAGEGLIGMSWALQVAGCPTAIVSQWKAASAPTARLMIELHRNFLAGRSKADSLRRAALDVMQTRGYAHPFYWAPFVVVGAP